MSRVAFLSMDRETIIARGFENSIYDFLTEAPLRALGWDVTLSVPWREHAAVDWTRFDLLVIRSPWDYQLDPDGFVAALEAIQAANPRLVIENPIETVRWNLSKAYLAELQRGGVPIVPTVFHEWPRDEDASDAAVLARRRDTVRRLLSDALAKSAEVVVKPMISAASDFTYRIRSVAHLRQTSHEGAKYLDIAHRPPEGVALGDFLAEVFSTRAFLVQPFLRSVVEEGEVSLFYFGGKLSHAIRKTPRAGDFRVQEEFDGTLRLLNDADGTVSPRIRSIAAAALNLVPPRVPLYARLDFIKGDDDTDDWRLIEMEVIEPSLYFNLDDGAAARFADAVHTRFAVSSPSSLVAHDD